MSSARIVRLVAMREIVTRVRSKGFLITTGVLLAGLVGMSVLVNALGGSDSRAVVGVTPETASLAGAVQAAGQEAGEPLRTREVASRAAGDRLVREGALDAVLVGSASAPRVVVEDDLAESLTTTFMLFARRQALDRAVTDAGGDPAAVSEAVARATVPVTTLDPPRPNEGERLALGMIVGVLLYIALLAYGQSVAQGVVEEKTSRVVELLLSTIRPWQLMAGKVLGIGFVGLAQLVVAGAAGAAAAIALGSLDLPAQDSLGILGWALVWYLAGFFGYALLFAAGGALVSRQEDVGSVVSPMMLLIIAPYIIGLSVLPADPESSLLRWLSIVPLAGAVIMPMRIAAGVAPTGEILLALGLTLVTIALLVRLTGRIYSNAVVRTGARVRVRDALGFGAARGG